MAEKNNQQGAPTAAATHNQSEAFILKYKNAIIGIVAAVVLIILGVTLYRNYVSGPKEQEASTVLGIGQELFAEENYEQALNGDSADYIGFIAISEKYSSTDAGNLAKLYAGLSYANLDQWEEAVKWLEKFTAKSDQMVSPQAIGALGNAYAHTNQIDKAVATLTKAAEKADNYAISPINYVQAAQLLETQGKNAEALKLYEKAKTYIDLMPDYQQRATGRLNIEAHIERLSQK